MITYKEAIEQIPNKMTEKQAGRLVDKMMKDGWELFLERSDEDSEEFYNRLSKRYKQVRLYEVKSSSMKDYYRTFAMAKDEIEIDYSAEQFMSDYIAEYQKSET